ncbi:MAG: hypothetical protein U9R05_02330 [Chloroflexota bacterium]|nr:hypothetical protein [Chloroflexota bacterium]
MVAHRRGRPPSSPAGGGLGIDGSRDWHILALSGAGIFFIVLGLAALGLPAGQEGELIWRLSPDHAVHLMDVLGAFSATLGVILTWLGSMLWQRRMKS